MEFKDLYGNIKDKGISLIIENLLNQQLKQYGEIKSFIIDSKNKMIKMECMMKDEKASIDIIIDKYEIIHMKDKHYFKFNNISVSREWINNLIQNIAIPNFAENKMIEIPSKYASIIDKLI